jgi:hypothetical protein
VLDPQGFVISQAAGYQQTPALGFDGANFLVVWIDQRYSGDYDIYGARVTPAGTVLDSAGIAVSTAANMQVSSAVAFDGANFLVVWQDCRNNPDTSDIYGARVTSAGVVFDEGAVVRQEGREFFPRLARGTGSQLFLVYEGWAGMVNGKTYNVDRIWGKMDPRPGVEETENSEVRRVKGGATVIRGVLFLPEARGEKREARGELLDVSGRRVLSLKPGPNDVSHLAPGVYFVHQASSVIRSASGVHRIVIVR